MSAAVASIALALVHPVPAQAQSESPLIDLYEASLLNGLHRHPVGNEGWRIQQAEAALAQRRRAARVWLVSCWGEAPLNAAETRSHDNAHGIHFVSGHPDAADEWQRIATARRLVGKLETSRRRAKGTCPPAPTQDSSKAG